MMNAITTITQLLHDKVYSNYYRNSNNTTTNTLNYNMKIICYKNIIITTTNITTTFNDIENSGYTVFGLRNECIHRFRASKTMYTPFSKMINNNNNNNATTIRTITFFL